MTKHLSEAERRAQILASAREEFTRNGYASARVSDVARRASLSKGAVYFYYPSKAELFRALVLAEHETSYAFIDAAEHSEGSALSKLLRLGVQYLDYLAGLDQPPRFFLMMTELGMRDEAVREECHALHQRFVDAVARIFAQGISDGDFRPMDPRAVAQMLKAMIDGFAGQAAIDIEPDRMALVSDGFMTILRGILADPDSAEAVLAASIGAIMDAAS